MKVVAETDKVWHSMEMEQLKHPLNEPMGKETI